MFREVRDYEDFCGRLEALVRATGLGIYAWALLPNHAHILMRTGHRPLALVMRSLLTGYAGAFNRRHRRRGHLFQNRYKSIVIEEEPYFLELVRYLHLNPLRARVVHSLQALAAYRYCGHGALLGRHSWPWQATEPVLSRFGKSLRHARSRYLAFVAEGIPQGRRPDLQGGGLVRSAGGWNAVEALRRGRESYHSDERILGRSEFVEAFLREVEAQPRPPQSAVTLESLVRAVCHAAGTDPQAVQGGGRTPAVCRAREGIAYLWTEALGRSGLQLQEVLGISPPSIYRARRRGREASDRWRQILAGWANA